MGSIAEQVREATEADFVESLRSAPAVEDENVRKARLRSARFSALRDAFTIAPDFDAPLPEEILRDFEGV